MEVNKHKKVDYIKQFPHNLLSNFNVISAVSFVYGTGSLKRAPNCVPNK